MAFIAPDLTKAALDGRLPRGTGVASLREAPAEWSIQFDRLGLPQLESWVRPRPKSPINTGLCRRFRE
jgi:hypothetical protein